MRGGGATTIKSTLPSTCGGDGPPPRHRVRLLVSASAVRPEALKVNELLPKNRLEHFDLGGRQVLGTAVANFHRLQDTEMGWLKITINLLPVAVEVAVEADEMSEDFAKSPEKATRAPPPPQAEAAEMAQAEAGGEHAEQPTTR